MFLRKVKYYLTFLILSIIFDFLHAQDINTRITVVSPYEPSVGTAQKINFLPVFSDTLYLQPSFRYSIFPQKLMVDYQPRPIAPAKMVPDPQPRLYKSYLVMGMGNKVTPLVELNIASVRNEKYAVGFYGKHQSSHSDLKIDNGQKMWAGYNDNVAGLYGKYIGKKITFSADGGADHQTVYYYGFNGDTNHIPYGKDDLRQDFLGLSANVKAESNHPGDSNRLYYRIGGSYRYLTDKFLTGSFFRNFEHGTHVNALFSKNVKGFYVSVDGRVDNYNRSSSMDTLTNTLITLHPAVMKSATDWRFRVGIKTIINHLGENSFLSAYPDIHFEFNAVQDVVRMYMGMEGGLKDNSYAEIVKENPFIVPNLVVRNQNPKEDQGGLTREKLSVLAGLKGSLSHAFEFNLFASYGKISNQYFFINDTVNRFFFPGENKYVAGNQFITVYDDVELLRFVGEGNVRVSSSFSTSGRIEINNYKTFKEEKPWNVPACKVSLIPRYTLRNKIFVEIPVYYFGKRYALSPVTHQVISMKDIVDINLFLEYRYTKLISLFLRFNNMAAFRYSYWNQYPLQRFFVMAGFTYSL